ncbi:hypothetical protein [Rhodococcus jostii]|uniref:PIN domain-containing protein n=1 Tax=Rhodococcus jostii TaxID=132919 RepID=A0ABU4CQN4_RHOJO|nr:hypothetical protein [Rhodococcus jostii]MDV6285874.1 hypothetical protein [Rhodococcus jostii]
MSRSSPTCERTPVTDCVLDASALLSALLDPPERPTHCATESAGRALTHRIIDAVDVLRRRDRPRSASSSPRAP